MAARLLAVLILLVPAVALGQRPVIERIEPTSGPPGTEVQIIGRRFDRQARFTIGQTELEVLRRLPNRWTVRIPDGAESGNVSVQSGGGRFRGPYFRVTEARPAPQIERIVPDQGPPGTEVTIHGRNFSPRVSENHVTLGSRPVVVRSATPTTLDVIVPGGAETGSFTVRVDHAAAQAQSGAFTVTAGTAITEFQPRIGPPGTQVTITGTGFSPTARDNRVYINNRPARVNRASETELVVTLPRGASSGPILVDVRGGGRAQTPAPFRIQYPPTVARVRPSAAPPGATVTIEGDHFGTDPRPVRVTLAGRPVILRSVTAHRLEVEIPAGAESGTFAVTVHGLGPAESDDFTVLAPVDIAEFTPRSGPVGTVVTIRGQGFSADAGDDAVTVGGTRATVVSASDTELRVRVPTTSSGPIRVEVEGSGSDTTSVPFLVTEPPFVAGFAPQAGAPGTEVTIRGRNFGTNPGVVRVTLNGRRMRVRSVDDERIVAVVPERASTGPIAVSVRLQGTGTSSEPFRVEGASGEAPDAGADQVVITAVEAHCARPGCHALIRGRGFSPRPRLNRVRFGDRPVRVERATATELRVVIPPAGESRPFRVEVRDGGEAESDPFTVTTGGGP